MDKVLQIASSVTTPLALAGVCLTFTFYLFRQILERIDYHDVPSGVIIMRVINVFFVLSFTAMVLGAAGWASTSIVEYVRHANARHATLLGFADMTTAVRDESYQMLTDYDRNFRSLVAQGYKPAEAKAKLFDQSRSLLDEKCHGDALGCSVRQAFPEYSADGWKEFFHNTMLGYRRFEEALDSSVERGTIDNDRERLESAREAVVQPLVDRLKELTKIDGGSTVPTRAVAIGSVPFG